MSFLTAEWRRLAFANYKIDTKILEPYVPFGTELDLWQGDCFVSLIGFVFKNVKLKGIKIPFHVNFEEVNLRFYVRRNDNGVWKRGVVFIKEIVPLPALVFVANTIYREHYESRKMSYDWIDDATQKVSKYQWLINKQWFTFEVTTEAALIPIAKDSETEFITEHYWGYAGVNDKKTNEYEVTHPRWDQYLVKNFKIDVDFETTYGKTFAFLNSRQPDSVFLAEGSAITIEGKNVIRKP